MDYIIITLSVVFGLLWISVIIYLYVIPVGKWFMKKCKKTQTAQVQRQAESSSNVNVYYVNSVYLPTVEIPIDTAEISSGSISNLQVDLDLPPSYSDLFGRRSTFA